MKKWLVLPSVALIAIIMSGCSTTAPTSNQSNVKTEYGAYETITLENHTLRVNKVTKNWQSSNEFDKPQSSKNMFVLINVTLKNTSNENLDFNSYGFKLEDDTGTQRDVTFTTVADQLETATLSPGGKTTGNMVFEAKKGSKKIILYYEPGLFGGDTIMIKL